MLIALIGVVAVWHRSRGLALLLLTPFALAIVAAIVQQYPFRGRLILYLVPGALLAVAAGAEWLRMFASTHAHVSLGSAIMLAIGIPPALAIGRALPPYENEQNRVVLAYLEKHRKPGDSIYTFPLSRVAMLYYGPRYGVQAGDFAFGNCDREDTRAYLRDVDRFRGVSRLWVLSVGIRAFRTAIPAVRGYLGTIGERRDSLSLPSFAYGHVSLELFDLSDLQRLGTASAATFKVAPMPTDPRPGCRPWATPNGPVDAR